MRYFYWGVFGFLIIIQYIFTSASVGQIRYEELAESVRNVFWLSGGLIYDGVSSNVGWYGTLLAIYNLLGFTLNSAKYFRLFLHVISLLSAALLIKKYLGYQKGIIPLTFVGSSPTWLYFNTFQTSYGIDLQYLPICLFILDHVIFTNKISQYLLNFTLWLVMMIAWLSYPPFVYFLPSLFIFYVFKLWSIRTTLQLHSLILYSLITLIGFVGPVLAALSVLKYPEILIYDYKSGSGIFRGAGQISLDLANFKKNISGLMQDLFINGQSYNYEIYAAEYSGSYPILSLIAIFILDLIIYFRFKKSRYLFLLTVLATTLSLLSSFTIDPSGRPGIRRSTGIVAAVMFNYCFVTYYLFQLRGQFLKLGLVFMIMLPIHHLLVMPLNFVGIQKSSLYNYPYFTFSNMTPNRYLDNLVKITQTEELKLSCRDNQGNDMFCRYSETYAAVAGYCLWNKIDCQNISGYDYKSDNYIQLTPEIWQTYYWEH